MKIAIISDLHSNREALEAVYEHIRTQGVTRLFRTSFRPPVTLR